MPRSAGLHVGGADEDAGHSIRVSHLAGKSSYNVFNAALTIVAMRPR